MVIETVNITKDVQARFNFDLIDEHQLSWNFDNTSVTDSFHIQWFFFCIFLYSFVSDMCFLPTICMSFGFECVPTQWKSLLKCNLAHSGAPSKKPKPERILLQIAPVLHICFPSWKQNPMEIFHLYCIIFCGVKWNIGHRFEMGKAFPHFWHPMHFHQNSRVTVDYEARWASKTNKK